MRPSAYSASPSPLVAFTSQSGSPRAAAKVERSLVRGAAGCDVAAREMQVAPDVVDLARFPREPVGERLGFGQSRERRVDPADETLTGRDSDERAATLGRRAGSPERNLIGIDRRLALPRFAVQPAAKHVERDDIVGRLRQRGAALGERQLALGLQRGRLRQRGVEVGARRLGRLGAIEMLGDEHGIALAVPRGGGAMQLRAAGARAATRRPRRGSARARTGTRRPAERRESA